MLKHYLKIAFRNLWRYKVFSMINLTGLSVSMAVCLLLITFIRHQQRFDHFHTKADRIYRVITDIRDPHIGILGLATTPAPLAEALSANNPQIEMATQIRRLNMQASYKNTTFSFSGIYAKPDFFNMFDFPLIHGNIALALREPFSIILTKKLALQFFGNTNAIGNVLRSENGKSFTVTGVMRDVPAASHLQFEAVTSYATLQIFEERAPGSLALIDWQNVSTTHSYMLLRENAKLSDLKYGLAKLKSHYIPDTANELGQTVERFDLQALTKINLGRELSNEIGPVMPGIMVYFLSILAAFIMIIACFNYVSLSIARSLKRSKEVGIRKVAGARRWQLILQFVIESVFTSLSAVAIGCVFLADLIQAFNKLRFVHEFNAQITLGVLHDPWLYIYFVGFSLFVGIVAGILPALSLSAFLPVKVLKGLSQIRGFSALTLRRVLIVSQFTLALVFIIIALFIYRQVNFMLTADYGFNRDHLVFVELQGVSYSLFRHEMINHSSIQSVSASSAVLVGGQTWQHGKIANMESSLLIGNIAVDEHFVDDLGLSLIVGRNFDPTHKTDRQAVILSEKAVQELGFKSPIEALGSVVTFQEKDKFNVIGVVKEFYFRPLFSSSRPLALRYDPGWYRYAAIHFHGKQLSAMLDHLHSTWQSFENAPPLRYIFFDDHLETEYAAMHDATHILSLVAGFAIMIACLGLLGMVIYAIETRTKEIGVRKVLGATARQLAVLLSRSFIGLLLIAIILALPVCWTLSSMLQQNFVQRALFDAAVFVWPVLGLLALVMLIIGSQTIKAALTKPVISLRYE